MAKVARAGLTFSATDLPPGLSIASSGKISGKIDANASRAYPVVIRAEDANGKSATDTFSWLISNETSVAGNVSGSGGNKAKFKQLTDPKNGSVALNGDGSFTYTPNPGFNGTDKFYYKTVNANGAVSPATVTIDSIGSTKQTRLLQTPTRIRLCLKLALRLMVVTEQAKSIPMARTPTHSTQANPISKNSMPGRL